MEIEHNRGPAAHASNAATSLGPDSGTLFVTADALVQFTGRQRPSAQARFLAKVGFKFTRRSDGSIALRREEIGRAHV